MKLLPQQSHQEESGYLRTKGGLVPFLNQSGQSAVEYLVICGVLIMALITMPSIYHTMGHTMKNKYRSYCFGVAISDPPRKAFDDAINKDADKVQEVIDAIKNIGEFIGNVIVPDILHGRLPDQEEIEKFLDMIKDLF